MAIRFFDIELPCDPSALKGKYRVEARRLHPDVSGADTKAQFQAMQAAYDALTDPRAQGVFSGSTQTLKTRDGGIPLAELGLGLGPLKNGVPCAECSGKGYSRRRDFVFVHGMRRHRFGGATLKEEVYYAICAPCKGTGETEMFNPVIPKGLLGIGSKTQKQRKRGESNEVSGL